MARMMFTECLTKKINFLGRKHKFDKNTSLDLASSSKWIIDSLIYIYMYMWNMLVEVV